MENIIIIGLVLVLNVAAFLIGKKYGETLALEKITDEIIAYTIQEYENTLNLARKELEKGETKK